MGAGTAAAAAATRPERHAARHTLVAALHSERTAWAVQNAVGTIFTVLFVSVLELQFSLACLCGVLYSASSLVLSLDRTIGGRLFGGVVFIGTVFTGASVGGAFVSLAWLARGDSEALLQYFGVTSLPDAATMQRGQDALAALAAVPLPPPLREAAERALALVSRELGALLPPVSSAYWALLMVLSAVVLAPLGAARAQRDFGKGIIVAIAAVFVSSMLVFGSLLPTLGEHLYWTQVVLGYFKVACVAAAANLLAGTLVYVRSAHDDLRRGCAALLRAQGLRISRLGTAVGAAAGSPKSAADQGQLAAPKDVAAAVDAQLAGIQAFVDARVAACCEAAGVTAAAAPGGDSPGAAAEAAVSEAQVAGLLPMPAGASDADLELTWAALEVTCKTARLEPPLPLLCSQPGSSVAKYAHLQQELARLQQATAVLGRGQAACLSALCAAAAGPAPTAAATEQLRSVLAHATALSAAACAGAAQALAHMPALAPCAGAALRWRPLPAGAWAEARAELAAAARQAAAAYQQSYQEQGLDFALGLHVEGHRALLFAVAQAAELLDAAQTSEAAAAAALDVPADQAAPALPHANGADAAAAVKAGTSDDVESGKLDGSLPAADAAAAAAAGNAAQPSALRRLAANPYISSFGMLLLLSSPLPLLKLTVDACWSVAHAVPALLTSGQAWRKALGNRLVQYGFKYWIALTGTVIVIIALEWKAFPSGQGPLQDAFEQANDFIVWGPMYASITVAICLQDTVEASLFRGILRATMTVLGGLFGYLVMLNGGLAQNPYWVAAWVAAFAGLAGLLAPDRSLRYSLFLAVFTCNATVLCQYVGCCGVPGDPKVFAGKVVSTVIGSTVAIIFGWLVLPWYGSQRMLEDQAAALRAALGLQRRMHAEVAAAAAEQRAVQTSGWLEAVKEEVQKPLARVAADLELSTLDRRQMPLTWHLLPEPAVLHLLQQAEGALQDRLAAAALVLRQDLFSEAPAGAQGPPAVVPGPVFRRVLRLLGPDIQALLAALQALVEACTANMAAPLAGSGLLPYRSAVADAAEAAGAARLHLHRRYLQEQAGALREAGGHAEGDFAVQAWLHAMLRSADEVVVVARLLLLQPAQDRDVLAGWVRAWRGHRVPPA